MTAEVSSILTIKYVLIFMLGFYDTHVLSQSPPLKTANWLQHVVPQNYVSFHSPSDEIQENEHITTPIAFYFIPLSLMSIEPKTMDFAVDFQITIEWTDGRLIVPQENLALSSYIIDIPKEIALKLWTPYIVLDNCKRCKHDLVDPTEQRVRLFSWSKRIYVAIESSYTFSCEINLANYPFDEQECFVVIEKFESRSQVPFEHTTDSEERLNPKYISSPPEFALISVKEKNCTNSSEPDDECMKIMFHLRRQYTHHIMLVFTPSMLIVVLSWISFWLDPDVTAPRVALGLTTLLTLATQFNSAQKDLPPVATVKALDIWMFACMFMVFSSLIEFALSNLWHRRTMRNIVQPISFRNRNLIKGQRKSLMRDRFRYFSREDEDLPGNANSKTTCIDMFARIAFPTIFISFNIFYWVYFTHIKDNE